MSFDKAKSALKMLEVGLKGLETIQGLTHLGGDKAAETLAAIDAIVSSIIDGWSGKATPESVEADLKAFTAGLAANDAAADAALHNKFDTSNGK